MTSNVHALLEEAYKYVTSDQYREDVNNKLKPAVQTDGDITIKSFFKEASEDHLFY